MVDPSPSVRHRPDSHHVVPYRFGRPPGSTWPGEALRTILPALAFVLSVNLLLAQPRVVHGQSMEPSLHESQRVILDLVTYRLRPPDRGEIVVLDVPEREAGPPLIKRVIGLPGDTVEIRQGHVYVNAQRLQEPYLDQTTNGSLAPTLIPEEHVFVLGDNRCCSNDSRYFGTVPYERLLGRAWLSYWPPAQLGFFD